MYVPKPITYDRAIKRIWDMSSMEALTYITLILRKGWDVCEKGNIINDYILINGTNGYCLFQR